MKKLLLLLTIFFLPLSVEAYSNYIIPGGDTLGIEVETDGIMIIGFYKIDGHLNKGSVPLKSGDYLLKVNNEEIFSIKEMTSVIEKASNKEEITLTFRRDGEVKTTILPLVFEDGKYKTGLLVKDSIKGIGTLSYIDPTTKIFGALGHEITQGEDVKSMVEIKSGVIFEDMITGIDKSTPGVAGSKLAKFNYEVKYGEIYQNTKYGIFGKYNATLPDRETLEVSKDVKIGKAYIKTVLSGQTIEDYEIEITAINENSTTKNITFKITDENLLNQTGGVVQGMSGSPIIQDGKIIGALTHVIVDNPITGYGIFITTMLEAGES